MTKLDMFACMNNNKRYQHSALYYPSLSEVLQLRKEFEHFNNYNYIGTSICLPGKCKAYFATNINFVSFGTLSYSPGKYLSFFYYNSSNIGLYDVQTRLISRIADSNFDLLVATKSLSIWRCAEECHIKNEKIKEGLLRHFVFELNDFAASLLRLFKKVIESVAL